MGVVNKNSNVHRYLYIDIYSLSLIKCYFYVENEDTFPNVLVTICSVDKNIFYISCNIFYIFMVINISNDVFHIGKNTLSHGGNIFHFVNMESHIF